MAMTEKILFLTGHIAEDSLRSVLASLGESCDFVWHVHNIGVHVAALMTPSLIRRRLSLEAFGGEKIARIIVPGRVRGDIDGLSVHFSVPVERGPDDLRELPEHFGLTRQKADLSQHACLIFAEITDAPFLSIDALCLRADALVDDGADVIDLGCLPQVPFKHLEQSVAALRRRGIKVSIDSADDDELRRGADAGADYVLSLHEGNLSLLDSYPETIPIIIPHRRGDMPSLYRAIDAYRQRQRAFFADPILDPLHAGFVDSLQRYIELRRRYKTIPILLGTANVTELCDSDSSGIVMLLMGLVSELSLNAVLTVQVSPHCRRVVAESDFARRLFFYAQQKNHLPIGIDGSLTVLHERKPLWDDVAAIEAARKKIRDKAWRITLSEEKGLHVYNGTTHACGFEPFDLFQHLQLEKNGAHAFYIGYELAKAEIARRLGKRYVQDRQLDWGLADIMPGKKKRQDG